jgi:hypothetical protein
VSGIDESNARRRLQLLCWKVRGAGDGEGGRRWFSQERAGSIGDWNADGHGDRFDVLLRVFVDGARAAILLVPVDDLLAIVDSMPDDIRGRVRAWLLSLAPDVSVDRLINEIANAIVEREPTGDDLALVDRVTRDAELDACASKWTGALGPAPTVVEVAERLGSHQLPEAWLRALQWVGILPEAVVGLWAQPASVMAAAYGRPRRETLEKRQHVVMSHGQSPMTVEELASLPVIEAARKISSWRPDTSEWLVSARELARTLEIVIQRTDGTWLETPFRVATDLRHPTYIHHYLGAVGDAVKAGARPPVAEILDVIALVRAHPWDAQPLGHDDFDYDKDWRGAEWAAVDVIRALADKDVGFLGRDDEVWVLLASEVRRREEPSSILSGAQDPLESAVNRPCTRALEAVLSFMAHEFRSKGQVRPAAFGLLEEALHLGGRNGAEHRAIIATRLGFLRHISQSWVDDHDSLLFGSDAPDGLAQVTADLAVKWSRPHPWLLEHHRNLTYDAVSRGVRHALDHLLIAMLWAIPGYAVQDNVSFLRRTPVLLSAAGETLGRLLREPDAEDEHVGVSVSFWDAAIATRTPGGLEGFGWMAEVEKMDDNTWASRTLETLVATGGRIDWSHKVAERAASLTPSTTTLAIMNHLVRGASDDWDRRGNIEHAVALLAAADDLSATPEYQRLRTMLLERGVL